MMTNFEEYLLGLYDNKTQAQSHPTEFAQVYILWEKIEGGYHSKNYYRSDGPSKPYRERYHKLVEIDETTVIVENYHTDWTRCEGCDMMFTFDGQAWHGSLVSDNCFVRDGVRVKPEIHLTKTGLDSKDQGFDSNGNMVFGSTMLYRFKRGRLTQR